MSANNNKMRQIGALADEFGLNPKTLRYYESIGLLREPHRAASGYRIYGETEREQLSFVMKARAIGLSLDEIGQILALRRGGEQPCEHVVELLDKRLEEVDSQLRALQEFRDDLATMRIEAAETANAAGCVCGIIEHHQSPHTNNLPVALTPRRRTIRRN